MRTADLPLHGGRCPRWLFPRMVKMSREISQIIINDYGSEEYLRRLSNPYFVQAFGCTIGFDWHSSGITTTLTGALKAANLEEFGIQVCGGKGKTSRKTPEDIQKTDFNLSEKKINKLVYASKISAKVDNNLLQDNYQLYHHSFFFDEKGHYTVIQQGMSDRTKYARRYHWLGAEVDNYVLEPHKAISCDRKGQVLNMVSRKSKETQKVSLDLVRDKIHLKMPMKHTLGKEDLSPRIRQQLESAYELQPENYEELVSLRGIGAKTIRTLALVSELVYNATPSWEEPGCVEKFAWAVGGKDGYPYSINKDHYDRSIAILKEATEQAKIGQKEKMKMIQTLHKFLT